MSEKLIINTNLLRKESEFKTIPCVVEKAIAVPHAEFDELKRHPLRDNRLIAENADMMYCDKDGSYHCLLIYDQERGDGLLIESEGMAYARYAQYIPRARELVERQRSHEISLTNSENRLLNLLGEMAERIANAVQHGYSDFTIDDILQDLDCDFDEVKEIMTHTVAQKLSKMDGIGSVDVSDLDIPFQPDISVKMESSEELSEEPEISMTM